MEKPKQQLKIIRVIIRTNAKSKQRFPVPKLNQFSSRSHYIAQNPHRWEICKSGKMDCTGWKWNTLPVWRDQELNKCSRKISPPYHQTRRKKLFSNFWEHWKDNTTYIWYWVTEHKNSAPSPSAPSEVFQNSSRRYRWHQTPKPEAGTHLSKRQVRMTKRILRHH